MAIGSIIKLYITEVKNEEVYYTDVPLNTKDLTKYVQ